MSGAWLSFARTGDPNHHLLPEWLPYSLDERPTMLFNTTTFRSPTNPTAKSIWPRAIEPQPEF